MQVDNLDDSECMFDGCTQVDVLPARCGACARMFCHDHFPYSAHKCGLHRDASAVTCPLCHKVVPCKPSDDPNAMVSRHIDRGCKDVPDARHDALGTRLNFCSFPTCSKNELALILCDKCGNSFCVDHRMPTRHQCAATLVTTRVSTPPPAPIGPRRAVSPQKAPVVSAGPSFCLLEPRNTPQTALGTYKGDNPVVLRVYFDSPGVAPFYFRAGGSSLVGRLLDALCQVADVRNDNNNGSAESAKQWNMFLLDDVNQPRKLTLNAKLQAVAIVDGSAVLLGQYEDIPEHVAAAIKRSDTLSSTEGGGSSCSAM